jgi:hypothetical protein
LTVLKGDEQWPHDRLEVQDRHSAGTYRNPTDDPDELQDRRSLRQHVGFRQQQRFPGEASYRLRGTFGARSPNRRPRCGRSLCPAWRRVAALAGGLGAMSDEPATRPKGRVRRAREPVAREAIQKVKLTQEERGQLRARAAELGMSVPRLMVESALSGVETPTDRRRMVAELFETRRLLATVANNVNQLAHSANITGQVSAGLRLEQTLAEVDELVAELRKLTGVRR